jgi:molybdate transport system ATP-binding protein
MTKLLPIAEVNIRALKRGQQVLAENISLRWLDGQHWCVTGATGSGKTTLLKTIIGQIQQPQASIEFPILDALIRDSQQRNYVSDLIAFVPQEVSVPTVYIEDLYYQRRFQAAEQAAIPLTKDILLRQASNHATSVAKVSALMHLEELLEQPFVQLSNGQTRRLMIALALLKGPKVLVLDNPYAGLDPDAREELNQLLLSLGNTGVHLLMAAHEHEIVGVQFITHRYALPGKSMGQFLLDPLLASRTSSLQGQVLKMENISVQYGAKKVLNALNWEVLGGDKWIISGRNGSGKSTLLSLIFADHPQAYANRIFWMGRRRGSGESIWDIKRQIGFFSPELLRYYDQPISAEEVIASGLNDIIGQLRRYTQEELNKIHDMADWMGIKQLLALSFKALSAGEQRLVLLARAFIKYPPVLILDEPLQGLDLQWRTVLKKKIASFSENRTILYVTHDEEEIPAGVWQRLELKSF